MNDKITLRVADIIGSDLCISAEDGQKIFEILLPLLKEKKHVTLSFKRITMLISLFLNVSIGQLYGTLTEEQIRAQLKVEDLDDDDLDLLKQVVKNAKNYYNNRKEYDAAWEEENDE